MSYNYDWKWALTNNLAVPCLEIRTQHSLVSCLSSSVKYTIREYADFAVNECAKRQSITKIPEEWLELCQYRSDIAHQYSPRWTSAVFYFRGDYINMFENKIGLDVGARVCETRNRLNRGILATGSRNDLLTESLVPHFKYYSNIGCRMCAIDLNAPDPVYTEIEKGDARCLGFSSEFFDFTTIPMLLGYGNPCATYLEIVFCLNELKRVLRPGGFIYIADAGFQPIVGFAGQCLGLELYVSKGSDDGLPLGLLFRKRKADYMPTIFNMLFRSSRILPLLFSHSSDEVVRNCNLLFDKDSVLIAGC